MTAPDGQPGSIPRARPLGAGPCVSIGMVMIVAGLPINLVTHTPVQWVLLCYIAKFITLCYACFLWVRLSN
jgi:hypothetical protein